MICVVDSFSSSDSSHLFVLIRQEQLPTSTISIRGDNGSASARTINFHAYVFNFPWACPLSLSGLLLKRTLPLGLDLNDRELLALVTTLYHWAGFE